MIDTHCHLFYFNKPGKNTHQVILEAFKTGVNTLINVGINLTQMTELQKISEEFEFVFHSIGVHPHETQNLHLEDLPIMEQALQHAKCVAVGEIGIDYYYEHSPKMIQRERLRWQLELALKSKKPVIIHSRNGEEDLLEGLKEFTNQWDFTHPPGVIHCFSGSEAFGKACLDLGFFISFSGILTFKNANELRKMAQNFPLDRLLLETDAPYLAPEPFRGKDCEPKMIQETAKKLAEVKGLSLEEIEYVTTKNAKTLFQIFS